MIRWTKGRSRAVTAFFRAFGGEDFPADGVRKIGTRAVGSHWGECLTLAGLVGAMVTAAWWDVCRRWMGEGWAWFPALALAWGTLHVLPFVSRCRRPWSQWVWWELVVTLWVLWQMYGAAGGWEKGAVRLWWGWMGLQLLGGLVLGWRRLMEVAGWRGVGVRLAVAAAAHAAWVAAGWHGGWVWWLAGGLLLGGAFCWGTLNPASGWWGPIYRRVEGEDWLLTIDDGPDPEDTPRMLDLLDRAGRKAVFFVIGEKVLKHPELAREIVRRGHELGNHTMTHPQAGMWRLGPWRTRREIEEAQRAIEETTGVRPRWFRAPVGHRNFFTHPVLGRLGLGLAGWTRRGFDTRGEPVEVILERIFRRGLEAGDVVLIHEATPVAAELLEKLLARASGVFPVEDDEVVVEGRAAPERADADFAEG